MLKGKTHLHVDGAFSIVPHPFYQLMVIMAFDNQTELCVPIMCVLMTGKMEELYWHALHWVFVASKWKMDPMTVTVDFELGLHNEIRDQFEDSDINGCLFHLKQALRRK